MTAPPFDPQQGHRWFAAALNNLAWDLVEAASRTDRDADRMIHAAHGACFHWLEVGDPIHHLRALCLLTSAYVAAGFGPGASRNADACLSLYEQTEPDQTPFDRACVHGCAAAAFTLARESDRAETQRKELEAAYNQLEDPEDRTLIDRLYRVPLPKREP